MVSPLILLWSAACAPLAVSPAPPTEPLPATDAPQATSTIVVPSGFYATQDAARQATIVARATASPFPTAGPPTLQAGEPASATTRRDGLTLQVSLPKDSYLAGEAGQAQVSIRNDGPEEGFVYGNGPHLFLPALLDERYREPDPWPWLPPLSQGPPRVHPLVPGDVISETVNFQLPPIEQAAGHTYVFWVMTHFGRPSPDYPEAADNLWYRLEAGPITLNVSSPDPSRQLIAELQADRVGWSLRVTDRQGQVPAGPLWGLLNAATPNFLGGAILHDKPDGVWSGTWETGPFDNRSLMSVRAWIAAPGHVIATVTQTLPGSGDPCHTLGMCKWTPPPIQSFSSLAAAQAELEFPVYQPDPLPGGSVLDEVQVHATADGARRWTDVTQMYRLPNNAWLGLVQMVTTEQDNYWGWGQARYDSEAASILVGQSAGHAIQHFGWWILDWKTGRVGFELRAPASALTLQDLRTIAEGIEPQLD